MRPVVVSRARRAERLEDRNDGPSDRVPLFEARGRERERESRACVESSEPGGPESLWRRPSGLPPSLSPSSGAHPRRISPHLSPR